MKGEYAHLYMKRDDYKLIFQQQISFLQKSCDEFDKGDEAEAIRISGHLRTLLHDSIIKKDFDSKIPNMILNICRSLEKEKFRSKVQILNRLNGVKEKIIHQQKEKIESKSLLTQMEIKEHLLFLDTSIVPGSFGHFKINFDNAPTTVFSNSYYGLVAKDIDTIDGVQIVKYLPLCLGENTNFINSPRSSFDNWWSKCIYDNGKEVKFSRKDLIMYVANKDGYSHIDENIDSKYENFKEANILENFFNSNLKGKVNLATLNSVRQIAFEVLESIKEIKI